MNEEDLLQEFIDQIDKDHEIYQVRKCFELVLDFFKDEPYKAIYWFTLENPGLGMIRPIDLMESGRTHKLLAFIESSLKENKSA